MALFKSIYRSALLILMVVIGFTGANAWEVKVDTLAENVYRLECVDENENCGIVTVLEGKDGLLVIDAAYYGSRVALEEAISKIGSGKVNTLIYTHAHNDHIGGSVPIGKGATIIAQENAAKWIDRQYGYRGDEAIVLPANLTFTDSMTINFDDETIEMRFFPHAHTNGDNVVWLKKANVVCVGDIFFSEKLPFIHLIRGGTVDGNLSAMAKVIADYPDDAIFVPGHNRICSKDDLKRIRGEVVRMVDTVRAEVDKGNDFNGLMAMDVLKEWKHLSHPRYTTDSLCVDIIYKDKIYEGDPPKSIADIMLDIILEDGIEPAVKRYYYLKENDPDHYDFTEGELNNLGYNLLFREMYDESIKVFDLYVETYPWSANAYDSRGEAYMNKGDKEMAIRNYEESLKLNPDNQNATAMLKQLRGQ